VEFTIYVVITKAERIKKMWDCDFNLVISDPRAPKLTMITEFVDHDCAGAAEIVRGSSIQTGAKEVLLGLRNAEDEFYRCAS